MTNNTPVKKKSLKSFLRKSHRKIFHVKVNFRCSDFNQKLSELLLAYIELKFRIMYLMDAKDRK